MGDAQDRPAGAACACSHRPAAHPHPLPPRPAQSPRGMASRTHPGCDAARFTAAPDGRSDAVSPVRNRCASPARPLIRHGRTGVTSVTSSDRAPVPRRSRGSISCPHRKRDAPLRATARACSAPDAECDAPDIVWSDFQPRVSRCGVHALALASGLHHPRAARDALYVPSMRRLCIRMHEPDHSRYRKSGAHRIVMVRAAVT